MSAVHGLPPFSFEAATMSGTTGYAVELVYTSAGVLCEPPRVQGGRLHLRPKPETRESPDRLAAALRGTWFTRVSVEAGEIVAELAPDRQPPQAAFIFFDLGPFQPLEHTPSHLVLGRRAGSGIATIELVAIPSEQEEWRRFLAREVDIVPELRPSYLRYLAEVPSVRLVTRASSYTTGILFQVGAAAVSDVRLRRAIALGVRRQALTRVVGGIQAGATSAPEDPAEARRLLAEIRAERGGLPVVHIILFSQGDEDQRAARVFEQQVGEMGISVELLVRSVEEMQKLAPRGEFEAILMPAGTSPYYYRRALSGHGGNLTHYANEEFDRAVKAGETARATAILERDVPMTPLYLTPLVVALDRRFCGARPVDSFDYSWLADVHPCVQGETE